jgi:(p)ppGpp synthase/HD superfamily hydrolase
MSSRKIDATVVFRAGSALIKGSGLETSSRFQEALLYATRLHSGQRRKGTSVPYISHLLSVAGAVLEHGADEDEAIAALLHDGPEDQGGMRVLDDIRERFGRRVADIVEQCTDSMENPKPPWRARKERYVARLRSASTSVRLVTAADKLHNVRAMLLDYRSLCEALWARFSVGKDDIVWYYRAIVEVLSDGEHSIIVGELRRTVDELARLTGAAGASGQSSHS